MIYDLANVVLSLASQCVQPIKIIFLFFFLLPTNNRHVLSVSQSLILTNVFPSALIRKAIKCTSTSSKRRLFPIILWWQEEVKESSRHAGRYLSLYGFKLLL